MVWHLQNTQIFNSTSLRTCNLAIIKNSRTKREFTDEINLASVCVLTSVKSSRGRNVSLSNVMIPFFLYSLNKKFDFCLLSISDLLLFCFPPIEALCLVRGAMAYPPRQYWKIRDPCPTNSSKIQQCRRYGMRRVLRGLFLTTAHVWQCIHWTLCPLVV